MKQQDRDILCKEILIDPDYMKEEELDYMDFLNQNFLETYCLREDHE